MRVVETAQMDQGVYSGAGTTGCLLTSEKSIAKPSLYTRLHIKEHQTTLL